MATDSFHVLQVKKVERGFATTSIVKKKDPGPETVDGTNLVTEAPEQAVTDPPAGEGAAVAGHSDSNGNTGNWEDHAEKQARDADDALAEKVKALSEKEYNKQIKILEYEKRMSSSYSDFVWDDPTDIVRALCCEILGGS